jgi:hypothetical protein
MLVIVSRGLSVARVIAEDGIVFCDYYCDLQGMAKNGLGVQFWDGTVV